jgi:predicted RNA-binding protein Jag
MKDGEIIPLKSIYCERLGFQIGFVNTDRKSIEIQAQANARLIAAAPDLLEVLQSLLQSVKHDDAGDGYAEIVVSTEDVQTARAAIAKATGDAK